MEKGSRNDDNYDNVNMDMSDESDNEMFACKEEYKAFKQQFSSKPKEPESLNEYGGDGNEYGGGDANEYGGGSSKGLEFSRNNEYGGAGTVNQQPHKPSGEDYGRHYGDHGQRGYGGHRPQFNQQGRPSSPTPAKIEREAKLYKDNPGQDEKTGSKSRRDRSHERRSKSKDRSKRTRSRSKGRRRSHSRDRGKDRRRSRSRSRDRGRDGKGDHHVPHDSRDRRDWRRDGRRDGDDGRRGRGDGRDRRGGGFRRERDEHRRNIEEQMRKVEEMGVEMPKYYKAGAINPMSYAEQVQKRKMLWKKPGTGEEEEKPVQKEEAPSSATSFNKWEATNFGDDKANEKFRRLMGIKSAPKPDELKEEDAPGKDSERIMNDLQKNYDQARQQTHRNRGIGLGFSNCEGVRIPQQPGQHGFGSVQGYGTQPQGPASAGRGGYGINFVKKH